MVNVKLVEKSVNSHVGREIDVNVMSQNRTPGITLNRSRIRWPTQPSQELEVVSSGVVASADARAIAVLVALPMMELSALEFMVELPTDDSMVGDSALGHKVHVLTGSLQISMSAMLRVSILAVKPSA